MPAFYSIVYANIRPSIGERVSIALLLRDETTVMFRHSPQKVNFLRAILSAEAFGLLITCVNSLVAYFGTPDFANQPSGYLSMSGNNLISFSAPKAIDAATNGEVLTRLFTKYVHTD